MFGVAVQILLAIQTAAVTVQIRETFAPVPL